MLQQRDGRKNRNMGPWPQRENVLGLQSTQLPAMGLKAKLPIDPGIINKQQSYTRSLELEKTLLLLARGIRLYELYPDVSGAYRAAVYFCLIKQSQLSFHKKD